MSVAAYHAPPPSHRTAHGFEAFARSWRVIAEDRTEPSPVTARATDPADALDAARLQRLFGLLAEHHDAATLREFAPYRLEPSLVVGGRVIEVVLPRARRAEFVAALAAILDETVTPPEVASPRRRRWRRLFAPSRAS